MKRQKNNEYDFKEPGRKRFYRPQKFAASRLGMAATQHYHATEAAIEILKKGGNAIDAAVSAAFALSVCEPTASGLGGQTMILIYLSGSNKKIAIDGSSRAPHRVVPGKYSRKDLFTGHKATTVPSTPAVLCYVLKTYGTMSLREVLEPAIRLAEEGYRITQLQHDLMVRELKRLRGGSAGRLFLIDGKKAYPVGTLFRQPVLARTLKTIAEKGIEEFYLGEIGRKIEKDMIENGGLIRYDDLAQIPWPVERTPLSTRFRDMRIITMGPPGAGRALIEALHIIENIPEDLLDLDTPDGVIALVEVIRQVNIDRRDRPVDPNIYHQLPARLMLRRDYAKEVARCITSFIKTGGETTHLSVADSKGNMVALTQSIERVFGSCEASPELGFLYNNYMSAFVYNDPTHPFYLRPAASPWASVAPTLVFKGRWPWLAIGSPGSERIVSAIVQTLVRLKKESPYAAVDAPRVHCSIKGKVSLEAPRIRDDILYELKRRGYELDERDAYSFYLGSVQLVIREKNGIFIGVADPRRDGSAGGPSL